MTPIHSIRPGTRVLMANFPADGHFQPLTGIAAQLKAMGCDVRWYTSTKYQQKIEGMNIPFYGLKSALDFAADDDIEKVFPERKKHKSQVSKLKFDMINAFILRGPEYYQDLKNIFQEFPFQVMIADVAFTGIPFVSKLMKIPVAGVSIFPLPETSKDLPPYGLGMTPSDGMAGRIKQAALRFIAHRVLFARPTKVMREVLGKYGIDSGNWGIFDMCIQFSNIILQSGTPGFEYFRSDISPHIHFVGPLLPYSRKTEREKWFHTKLNQYHKIVLVTQGTVERDVTKIIVPTLEAFKNSDVLVVVTTGGSLTEELREKYPQENIIIEDFIPYDDIMPYADVYVTNGGYGGVLLSLKHGLPMVGAGIHEGKNEINARIGYLELGINCQTEKPTPQQIRKAVEKLLTDPHYRINVKKLKHEFTLYNPEANISKLLAGLLEPARMEKRKMEEAIY